MPITTGGLRTETLLDLESLPAGARHRLLLNGGDDDLP